MQPVDLQEVVVLWVSLPACVVSHPQLGRTSCTGVNYVCAFHGITEMSHRRKGKDMLTTMGGYSHLQVQYYLGNASGQSLAFTMSTSAACAPVHTLVEAGKVAGPFAFAATPVLTCMGTRLSVRGTTVIPGWGNVSATEGPGTVVLNAYPVVPSASAAGGLGGLVAACPPGQAWCKQCTKCMKKLPPGESGSCCNLSGWPTGCVIGPQKAGTINCQE